MKCIENAQYYSGYPAYLGLKRLKIPNLGWKIEIIDSHVTCTCKKSENYIRKIFRILKYQLLMELEHIISLYILI